VVSTILVSRKLWPGLIVAAINSVVICIIGVHTGQYGFIVANIFCIFAYLLNIRSWVLDRKTVREYREYMSGPAFLENSASTQYSQSNARPVADASPAGKGLYLAYSVSSFSNPPRNTAMEAASATAGVLVESRN